MPEPTYRPVETPGAYADHVEASGTVLSAERPGWSVWSIVAIVLVVMVVSGGSTATAWYLIHRSDDPGTVPGVAQAGPAPVVQPQDAPTTPPPVDAASALAAQADSDAAAAGTLVGWWVPQLSSKAVGMEVDGVRYDEAAILQNFRTLQGSYPGAVLVRSSDYSSFKRGGLWVVLANAPFDNAAAANGWCDGNGIARDECYAKRLSTTEGPTGNTVLR